MGLFSRFQWFFLHSRIHDFLYAELVLEKQRVFLAQDGEHELVVEFQPVQKVYLAHDGVFYLASEEYAFQKVVEFDAVHVPNDEYVDNLVRGFREKVSDFSGNGNQSYRLLSLEKILDRSDGVVRFHEHVEQFVENNAVLVDDVELFFVVFLGFADSEFFQIHQFPADRVDLFPEVTAEFADEKPRFSVTGSVLDKKFLEEFGAAVRSKEFGKTGHIVPYNMGKHGFPK